MANVEKRLNAEVTAVYPNKVRIAVTDLKDFSVPGEKLTVGSYIRVSDHENCAIIAVIENYMIEQLEGQERKYIIEANPIGFLDIEGTFHRGGTSIAIPPIDASPAKEEEIQKIYSQIERKKQFCFAKLSQLERIRVPIDGDSFFNKHVAIVGSTGSGKSHAVTTIIQKAVLEKESEFKGLNNSHVVIFDLHGEYNTAFPNANMIDVRTLQLPYWLMNEEELEELLIERGGEKTQAYNLASLLRRIITRNKIRRSGDEKVTFGSPVPFSMNEVINCLVNLSIETVNYEKPSESRMTEGRKEFESDEEGFDYYSESVKKFEPVNSKRTNNEGVKKGTYNDGTLDKFINRLRGKVEGERLKFLFDESCESLAFEDVLRQLLAYKSGEEANVTLIDLSGIPFEVLSITVSLISRLLFEYGYYFKRFELKQEAEVPLLLIYEEAHKYVPKAAGARYDACRTSIERVAKEGRKYGCTLVIMSQRPAEISETIFSQCNNFIAMRLTNPEDQNYVKRLLPDSLGPLTDSLPTLKQGEALLIGEAVIMPSLVRIDRCNPEPSSKDIPYLQEWKKQWEDVDFGKLANQWSGKVSGSGEANQRSRIKVEK
ncbi:MAG: ATP-binding protein [Planctomycetota bacterium]|jgi:DNA helicase HerA-like ATPase